MPPSLKLLRVQVQWAAVFEDGDEPREEVVSAPILIAARDWPKVHEQIEADLVRITETIVEAGGFVAFQEQIKQQQG